LDRQIGDQRHLHHEVRRSGGMRGIWYSHFSLFPQTIAAEILRLAGRDLYDGLSPEGHTLRQAFEPLAGWSRDPSLMSCRCTHNSRVGTKEIFQMRVSQFLRSQIMRLLQRSIALIELESDASTVDCRGDAERRQVRHWSVLINPILAVA